ncbi:hypothetical protein HK096_011371 [Nowakowskiella sp. JEL0078]|nr:hypothetical protein HK096_011371 [Nowakowskiella sp. JEL0078]
MGAKIGRSVEIDSLKTTGFREYDLIEIGDECAFDTARIRPFAMEGGNMLLNKIKIGNRCTVNISTVIAPGAHVPSDTSFPPLSSSHEIQDSKSKYHNICRTVLPGPNIFLKLIIGYPLVGFVNAASMIPWVASLYLLGVQKSDVDLNRFSSEFADIIIFFSQIYRIIFKCLALIARDVVSPFIFILLTIAVKRVILGLGKPEKPISQWDLLRSWVMAKLLGDGSLGGLNKLIGKHYEYTSMIYRALGANVGSRIYWPGTGLRIGDHEYLNVGDDVVFGSRTHIVTRDANGKGTVTIDSGAMIADRCVLLPGVHVGRHAMLGTGSLGKRHKFYPPGSIYLGSKKGGAVLWDEGNEQSANEMSTITPFGISFYGKQASFKVIPMWFCALYCIFFAIFHVIVEFMPLLGSIQVGGFYFRSVSKRLLHDFIGAFLMIASYIVFAFAKSMFIMALSITAKWVIHGKRKPGKYNWDESSYCQRWQILIAIQSMNSELLESIRGSWYLVVYFRLIGSTIGERVCLYPTGADPMMTEADLVTIGDNVMIDNGSVICHINSKGQFSLNPLIIRDGASMRAQSRLLSGAEMDEDAVLMEHTLILSGDVAAKGVWQGWPLGNQKQEQEDADDSSSEEETENDYSKTKVNVVAPPTPKQQYIPMISINNNRESMSLSTVMEEQWSTINRYPETNINDGVPKVPLRDASRRPMSRHSRRSGRSENTSTPRRSSTYLREEDYMMLRQRARKSWIEIDDRMNDLHFSRQSRVFQ